MRWRGGRQSDNIEDQRGGGFSLGRGGGRFPIGMRTGGIGGLGLILLVILGLVFGIDPGMLMQTVPSGGPSSGYVPQPPQTSAPGAGPQAGGDAEMREFVAVVLAETEDAWNAIFQANGRTYEEPRLVLFSGMVGSACGMAQAASGPFYCPLDHKVYLDFSFFDELEQRFGAPGDFAQAYVIAHEIGHHVQNQLGILPQVEQLKGRVSRSDANQLSVMVELQADCFAGVWANRVQQRERKLLEAGDIEEGIRAAGAVGDDRIQRQTQGYVVPDAFTHGSAQQRARWFRRGLEAGNVGACDTFNAPSL
jgi:predicted metalloprotease